MSYLDELNKAQRDAVEYIDGPALVIAGAGSGKTRVLTYKIMHLLNNGYNPWNILALTFTNKAAKEMKERIAQKIGNEQAQKLHMGTFHSVFMRILRAEAPKIGFHSNFTIYDQADAKSVVRGILKEMKLDAKLYPENEVCSKISKAKNNLITAAQYETSALYQDDVNSRKPLTSKIFRQYVKKCQQSEAMDFDDLLLYTHLLFENNPDVVNKYSERFKYILVDEYQDTNSVQYRIVKALASAHRKVFVVGDDAQSIYSFRGAQIENILNFQKDYREAKLFKLEQNYRSTKTIVNAANSVIACNSRQIKKESFSDNEQGCRIRVSESAADNEEGFLLAADIVKRIKAGEAEFKDFAFLYRTNSQSRILEESLRKRSIPYKIYGGLSFYQRKEIKDLIAYLRLLVNPDDDEAFKRVVNYPKRGIGDTSIEKISEIASQNGIGIWKCILNFLSGPSPISARTINAIHIFIKLIADLKTFSLSADAYQTAMQVASASGILKELNADKTPEGISRYDNVQELLNGIKAMCETSLKEQNIPLDVQTYLETVSLMTGDEKEDDGDKNRVTLMTIHSSKGLEFDNVYLTGVEEGLFPSSKSVMSNTELEEERRLFYVAVTRARKSLSISFARMRYKWGQLTPASPSRFIKEIDPRYLDFGVGGRELFEASDVPFSGRFKTAPKPAQPEYSTGFGIPSERFVKVSSAKGFSNLKADDVKPGTIVEHEKFGKGKVVSLEGSAPDIKLIIDFMSSGRKTLLIKFAKLKIVN